MRHAKINVILGLASLPFHRWVWQQTSVWDLMPAIVYVGLRTGWRIGELLEVS